MPHEIVNISRGANMFNPLKMAWAVDHPTEFKYSKHLGAKYGQFRELMLFYLHRYRFGAVASLCVYLKICTEKKRRRHPVFFAPGTTRLLQVSGSRGEGHPSRNGTGTVDSLPSALEDNEL